MCIYSKAISGLFMISEFLRYVSCKIPNTRYIRAIPSRILKPIHQALGLEGGVVDVLGLKMRLDPKELVDSDLWFNPQFYDRNEIRYLLQRFPEEGTFVDVGANIGFWSLMFAKSFPRARICAIEANPDTYDVLRENIAINYYMNIVPVNIGVSDKDDKLPLYCNDTGNRGGDSFSERASGRARNIIVQVKPLYRILRDASIKNLDMMKIDIEGFEDRALSQFFKDAPTAFWPKFICVEVSHVPEARDLIIRKGYQICLLTRENCILLKSA